MATVKTSTSRSLTHRLFSGLVVFFVVAIGLYATAYLTLGLLRQIVMPVLAIVVAGYLAVKAFRYPTGPRGD